MASEKQNSALRRTSIERILGRLDDLDSTNLAILVQRLARERSLLDTVFDAVEEGILVIDETGTVDYANRAGMAIIGLNPKEIGAAVLWKLVPDLARSLDFLREDGLAPNISRDVELFYPEHRWVRLQISRLILGDDAVRFGVIIRDITDERQSTEEMIESERINSIFTLAASVAHEIGNPLNSMKIHLELMKRKLAAMETDAPQKKSINKSADICLEEINRLDGILNDFLGAIRPQKPKLVKTNLLVPIRDVLDVQKGALENRNIRYSVTQRKDLPIVLGDTSLLKQLIFNVTKNAMEAMQDGGRLDLETDSDDAFVYLRVRDTGCGIERDEISKIYEPFFTTKNGGHGIGMIIVMRIMREHGGQLGIDSTPGEGTLVTLQFPRPDRRTPMLDELPI